MVEQHIYTLSELADEIADAIFSLEPEYWVEAEILSLQERGHCYLELAEKGETGEFAARVRATCWQNTWRQLKTSLLARAGALPAVGMKVRVRVTVEYHPVYGLSLNIHNIDPVCTLGELARKRQETIAKLTQEELTDLQRSLVLPTLVRRLAVISSDTAAGYQDFVNHLQQTPYRIDTTLYPATMQGDGAEASILSALAAIATQPEEFDAVVIIRGGGATADLSCFDSYALCRACALFPLPIISGIGHTRDVSVLDMVSHLALKTPTAVADWLIERFAAEEQRLIALRQRLAMTARLIIERRRHRIEMLAQRLDSLNPERIYRQGYSLLTRNGKIVRSVADVHSGDTLTTHLIDGTITSTANPL